jgi:hypothetical protein
MKKIILIPLLLICFFVKVKGQVINSQSQKYLKQVEVVGSLFADTIMANADSSKRYQTPIGLNVTLLRLQAGPMYHHRVLY